MTNRTDDKVHCRTPTPGKKGTNIDRWKFDAVRAAILKVVPRNNTGMPFSELPEAVEEALSDDDRADLGSIMWYITTVKLEMEVRGDIARIDGVTPQRIRRP